MHLPLAITCEADGGLCTADACISVLCQVGGSPCSEDSDPCTIAFCDAATGACSQKALSAANVATIQAKTAC